jgi:hypothetical protein
MVYNTPLFTTDQNKTSMKLLHDICNATSEKLQTPVVLNFAAC